MIGKTLGHYKIIAKIGEGGMGVVYKAKDSRLDRFVAIKVLPPERMADAGRKARFKQEAKAASALNHPNIITVHDIDQQDGVDFIVMEYVPGKTLNEIIPRKGIKLSDTLKYAVQIADALAKAHSAGIIHRDVKPYNVMVSEDGRVKVLDFGLAKLTEAEPPFEDDATRTEPTFGERTVAGTAAYMSPEQAEGQRLDARSDIFSFGSVLYEMITGRQAFKKESKTSTLAAIIHKEPEPLGTDIPQELNRIIKRCLRKDRAHRFQTMADLKVALEEVKEESDSGGLAPIVSVVEKTKKTIAVLPFADLSPDSDQGYFVDGLSEELLNTLTQIPNLSVIARTSSFSFKGTNMTVQEIASALSVENILEGSVRKAGGDLRITARLIRAKDDVHLWSKTYKRELKDIFAVQEDIAMAVANELKATLGLGKSLKQLGGTDNEEAYELYLVAQGQYRDIKTDLALRSLDAALAIDPEFAIAWASKSIIHTWLTVIGPANQAAMQCETGLSAAQKAVKLEPNLAAAYYSLGYARSIGGNFIEAGLAYRKALELTSEPLSFIMPVIAIHYLAVGYFRNANELLGEMLRNDPLNQGNRTFIIMSLSLLGDAQRAEEENKRAKALLGSEFDANVPMITYVRLGTKNILSRDEIAFSNPVFHTIKEYLDSPKEGLAELHRLYIDEHNLSVVSLHGALLGAAYFGDLEFAVTVLEKTIDINAESICLCWLPVFHEVRQTPRFKALVKKIGLVDYWNKFGWPDICRPLDNGDFKCD